MRHALADLEGGGEGGTGVSTASKIQELKKVIKQDKTQKKWKGKRKIRESVGVHTFIS